MNEWIQTSFVRGVWQEIDCFPLTRVTNPTIVSDTRQSSSRLYKNVVIFIVQSETRNPQLSEMHLFQAAGKQQVREAATHDTQAT